MEAKLAQKREAAMSVQEALSSPTKARFGLFSSPAPVAVGETNFTKKLKANKGDDGKPITGPISFRNNRVK